MGGIVVAVLGAEVAAAVGLLVGASVCGVGIGDVAVVGLLVGVAASSESDDGDEVANEVGAGDLVGSGGRGGSVGRFFDWFPSSSPPPPTSPTTNTTITTTRTTTKLTTRLRFRP